MFSLLHTTKPAKQCREKLVYDSGGTDRSLIVDNLCGPTRGVHKFYTNLGTAPKS